MIRFREIAAGLVLLLGTGCAQYMIVAPEPRYAGQVKHRPQVSIAGGTATSPAPVVSRECGPGEQLAMVRVTRDFGQGLLGWLTFGLYAPATIHFRCASEPPVNPSNGIDTGGGR